METYERSSYDDQLNAIVARVPDHTEQWQHVSKLTRSKPSKPSGWHFFVSTLNPSSSFPDFLGEPTKLLEGLYLIQVHKGVWKLMASNEPSSVSVDLLAPPKLIEHGWMTSEHRGLRDAEGDLGMGIAVFGSTVPLRPLQALLAIMLILTASVPASATPPRKRSDLSAAVKRALSAKELELGITSLQFKEDHISLIHEGFDLIERAKLWINPSDDSSYAIFEHNHNGGRLTFKDKRKLTKYSVVRKFDLPGSLLLDSHDPSAGDYRYTLVNEKNPFVSQPLKIALPKQDEPVVLGKALRLETEKGSMLVPLANPYITTEPFEHLGDDYHGNWLLTHGDDSMEKHSLALKDDVTVRSERFRGLPQDYGKMGWLADQGYTSLLIDKSTLKTLKEVEYISDAGDKCFQLKLQRGIQIVSREDLTKASPELENWSYLGSNMMGILSHHLGAVLIKQDSPEKYSRPFQEIKDWAHDWRAYDESILVRAYEPGAYDREVERIRALKQSAPAEDFSMDHVDEEKHPRSRADSAWNFLIRKDDPTVNSPLFLGHPVKFEHSYLVQNNTGVWTLIDKQNLTITSSIELSSNKLTQVDGTLIAPSGDGKGKNRGLFRLFQENDIRVHTDVFKGKLKQVGKSWHVQSPDGMHYLLLRSNLKQQSRPFVEEPVDYGDSVAVRTADNDGSWRLLRKDAPLEESIPFRRILQSGRGLVHKLMARSVPGKILVEKMDGKPVWLSTSTLAVAPHLAENKHPN